MAKRGILWRVLGDNPELWQSAEAWSVVADLCEQEVHGRRAQRIRQATSITVNGRRIPSQRRVRISHLSYLWRGWSAMLVDTLIDTDGEPVQPSWAAYFDEHDEQFWVLVIVWPKEPGATEAVEAAGMLVTAL